MGEWNGFLTDDYAVEEAAASVAYSETDVVVVETEVVEELHVQEVVEVTEVAEVSFESYLSVTETGMETGTTEADAFAGVSYDHTAADEDSGFSHDGGPGYDVWS